PTMDKDMLARTEPCLQVNGLSALHDAIPHRVIDPRDAVPPAESNQIIAKDLTGGGIGQDDFAIQLAAEDWPGVHLGEPSDLRKHPFGILLARNVAAEDEHEAAGAIAPMREDIVAVAYPRVDVERLYGLTDPLPDGIGDARADVMPAPSDELFTKYPSGRHVCQDHRAVVALDAQDWAW